MLSQPALLLLLPLLLLSSSLPHLTHAQQSPCAQLTSSTTATQALTCLRSIPVQDTAASQLRGLNLFLQFQSDLLYLNSTTQPSRLYPPTDLLDSLSTLQVRIQEGGYYENEYDFQLDIAKIFLGAHDGHLAYIPDLVASFAFVRVREDGERFPLMSVSTDGVEIPRVYAYADRFALADDAGGYEPSPIEQIDGQDVVEFLNQEAANGGLLHDPDANWGTMFPSTNSPGQPSNFEQFFFFREGEERNETVLGYANRTEQRLEIRAAISPSINLDEVNSGEDFFEECCSGTILSMLGDVNGGGAGGPTTLAARGIDKLKERAELDVLKSYVDPRPVLRRSTLERRQDNTGGNSSFPEAVTPSDVGVSGYFPESASDLAVLTVSSFLAGINIADPNLSSLGPGITTFQSTVSSFLDAALEQDKTRLIIDLRGNGGGLGYLAHDLFRTLFPSASPYDAGNYRVNDLFNFTGQALSTYFEDANPTSLSPIERQLFAGAFPFNFAQQLDGSNTTFDSWQELVGPAEVPTIDAYTNLIRPNLTNPLQTIYPIFPLGRSPAELARPQVFSADNIILLQDGACASACAIFTEFMKNNAPGDGSVRQVLVGGRPQTGPAQGVGGVKGGQLAPFSVLAAAVLTATQNAFFLGISGGASQDDITDAVAALDRGSEIASGSVNFRNTIREGDNTVTPLQYVYDAADYRIFHTAAMYGSQELLWQKAYEVAWENGDSVADSTGHPSAQFGTVYESIDIPDNAASDAGVSVGGGSSGSGNGDGSGSSGGSDNGGDGDEESSGIRIAMSTFALGLGLAFAVLAM